MSVQPTAFNGNVSLTAAKPTVPASKDPGEQHANERIEAAFKSAEGFRASAKTYHQELAKTVGQLETVIVAGHDAQNFISKAQQEVKSAQTIIDTLAEPNKSEAQEGLNKAVKHMNASVKLVAATKQSAKKLGIKTDAQVVANKSTQGPAELDPAELLTVEELTDVDAGAAHANQTIQSAVKAANSFRASANNYREEVTKTEKQLDVVVMAGHTAQGLTPGVAKEIQTALTVINTLPKAKQGNPHNRLNRVFDHMAGSIALVADTKKKATQLGIKTDAKVAVNTQHVNQSAKPTARL